MAEAPNMAEAATAVVVTVAAMVAAMVANVDKYVII
jgi:hypothetical protein